MESGTIRLQIRLFFGVMLFEACVTRYLPLLSVLTIKLPYSTSEPCRSSVLILLFSQITNFAEYCIYSVC